MDDLTITGSPSARAFVKKVAISHTAEVSTPALLVNNALAETMRGFFQMAYGRILIVSHSSSIRKQLTENLAARDRRISAVNPDEMRLQYDLLLSADLIIIDGQSQEPIPLAICRVVRDATPSPIILLSTSRNMAPAAVDAGADYYLTRPIDTTQLMAFADAALRRELIYNRSRTRRRFLRVRDLSIDLTAHELRRNGRAIPLSNTEFKLLCALAAAAGRVLTREQLLSYVWQPQADGIFSRTVDVHVARIRRKLGDAATTQHYIKTAPGVGYLMPIGEESSH